MQNKVSKYFLYAIGEIALVMIGILLALQVNTWNENRKDKIKEQQLLQEYKEELKLNREIIADFKSQMIERTNSCDIILKTISEKLPYVDSLSTHFYVFTVGVQLKLSELTLNSLETQGVEIIRNRELKKRILALQTNQFGTLNHRIENQYANVMEYGRPLLRRKFKTMGHLIYQPVDSTEIMESVEVWNILKAIRGNYIFLRDFLDEIQVDIDLIEELINLELE